MITITNQVNNENAFIKWKLELERKSLTPDDMVNLYESIGMESYASDLRDAIRQYDLPKGFTAEHLFEAMDIIDSIPRAELPRVLDEANNWKWPEEFGAAPENWDSMSEIEKHNDPMFRALFHELSGEVSRKAQLRYHHTHCLGRTEAEFEDWWESEIANDIRILRNDTIPKKMIAAFMQNKCLRPIRITTEIACAVAIIILIKVIIALL